jgi:hypothetical protein
MLDMGRRGIRDSKWRFNLFKRWRKIYCEDMKKVDGGKELNL